MLCSHQSLNRGRGVCIGPCERVLREYVRPFDPAWQNLCRAGMRLVRHHHPAFHQPCIDPVLHQVFRNHPVRNHPVQAGDHVTRARCPALATAASAFHFLDQRWQIAVLLMAPFVPISIALTLSKPTCACFWPDTASRMLEAICTCGNTLSASCSCPAPKALRNSRYALRLSVAVDVTTSRLTCQAFPTTSAISACFIPKTFRLESWF